MKVTAIARDGLGVLCGLVVGVTLLLLTTRSAAGQTALCTGTDFGTTPGAVACNGTARPLTVTATVRTYANLSLDEVFGRPSAALQVALGTIDANCMSAPEPGVTCTRDATSGHATWYGTVQFRVRLTGLGGTRAKLTGLRPTSGSIPAGRLLDGDASSTPARPYPVAPATSVDIKTGLGNGESIVTRTLGLDVRGSDPPGAWTGTTVYSLVIE